MDLAPGHARGDTSSFVWVCAREMSMFITVYRHVSKKTCMDPASIAHILMACIVMAHLVMAYTVMADIVMAYRVAANILKTISYGLCSYGPYSYGA